MTYVKKLITLLEEELGPAHQKALWYDEYKRGFLDNLYTKRHYDNAVTLIETIRDGSFVVVPDGNPGVATTYTEKNPEMYLRFTSMQESMSEYPPGEWASYRIRLTPEHAAHPNLPVLTGVVRRNRKNWHPRSRVAAILGSRYDAAGEWMVMAESLTEAGLEGLRVVMFWASYSPTSSSLAMLRDLTLRDGTPYLHEDLLRQVRQAVSPSAGWAGNVAKDKKLDWDKLVVASAIEHYSYLLTQKSLSKSTNEETKGE